MEKIDCEKIVKEMRECVTKNQGTYNCKEIVEVFEKNCEKKEGREEHEKLFLE